jgi:O-antigen/teichoic acid export membrane protein
VSEPRPAAAARRLARDFAALAGGEVVAKIAGFAAFAWLARALAPEAYGAVELAVALSLFFVLVVDWGFGPIGAREIARAPERAPELAALVPAARMLLAALAAPAMVAAALLLGQPSETVQLVALFAAGLLFAPWTQRWLLQGLDMMGWVSAAQALRMGAFALGAVLLVRGSDDLLRVGWLELAASAVMAAYFAAVQAFRIAPLRLSFRREPLGRLAREARAVGASQLVWAVNQYLPTALVAGLLGGAEIAWFGGAHRIVLSLGTFVWLYHFNLFPSLARATARTDGTFSTLVGPSFRVTAWLGIGGALVLSLLAEPLCRIAFGPAFGATADPFRALVWVLPVALLSGHARFGLIAAGHQEKELAAQLAGAVVTVGAGALAIPALGARGGAFAMVASACVVWAFAHRAARRHVGALPLFGPIWRPAAAAAGAAALGLAVADSPWAAAAMAGAAVAAAAPLLDPALVADLRRLAGAKAQPAAAGAVSGGRR